MKKMVLFDENSNFIDSIEFEANEFFKASEKIEEVEELPFNEFFNVIEYGVDIYKPYNDGEDFIIQNVNKLLVDSFEGSNLDLIGRLLSKSCPVLYKLNVLNIIKEVYETGETKQFRVEYYDDDVLLSLFDHSFIKYKENIFIFAKSVDDLELLVEQEENLFSKSIQGLFVIQNESIVRVNNSFSKMVGYSSEEILNKEFYLSNICNLDNLKDNSWEDVIYNLVHKKSIFYEGIINQKTKNGRHIFLRVYAVPIFYKNHSAIQVSCVDITKSKENETKALRFKNALDLVQNVSKIAFMYWNKEDKFQWTDEIYNILEIDSNDYSEKSELLPEFIVEKDKYKIANLLKNASINSDSFESVTQVKVKSGLKDVVVYVDFSLKNQAVAYVQDITESINREKALKKALVEKDYLIKEVNHRVKNNLQIILSLLNLDLRNSDDLESAIQSTQNRIKAMAFIHEKTYESADLDHVNLKEYIDNEAKSLLEFYGVSDKIHLNKSLSDVELSMETATPLRLAINEIIINIIKYAFPEDQDGTIDIFLTSEGKTITLIMGDDGVGLPDDVDIYNSPSLGLTIINSLVSQIGGSFKRIEAPGTVYEIKFNQDE